MISLSNPWLAGISAGVASGVIVAWISQMVLSRRDRGGTLEKAEAANREILEALRLALAEGQIPRRETLFALTRATARRHGLTASELYQPSELAEELTKDVMESHLLSAGRKSELCAQLSYLLMVFPSAASDHPLAQAEVTQTPRRAAAHGKAQTHTVSALTGVLGGVLSGVFAGRELLARYMGAIPHGLRIGIEALAGIAAALLALAAVALLFGDSLGRHEDAAAEAAAPSQQR